MERKHRSILLEKFGDNLTDRPLHCLDIPDDYEFMDPELVRLLEVRVQRYLG